MKVILHADASREAGTGHVTRCLALAAALRADGADVALASDELVGALAASAASLGVEVLSRRDAPRNPDWIVVDGYHLDSPARRALAEVKVPRLVLDDLGGHIDADVVLNQNLYASPAGPTSATTGELLAGAAFALLGPEFVEARPAREQPPVAARLLVTMGGSDPHDATGAVVRALRGLDTSAQTRIVIGGAHPAGDRVAGEAEAAGFAVVRGATTLAPHLAWADVVVSGCGTTVLEAARLGRPIVGVVLADNQVAVAAAVEREKLGVVVGRHPSLDVTRLRDAVADMSGDAATRRAIAARGPQLVDGTGARRVAAVVATGPLLLRAVTMEDAELLLAWRNDPATREASFDRAIVDRETHVRWLEERLDSDANPMWIGLVGGRAAGVVRFAVEDARATASVTVAPEQRGRGLATRLVMSGCARLARERVVEVVDAWIRPDNAASIAAFRAAGFRPANGATGRLRFSLPLRAMA